MTQTPRIILLSTLFALACGGSADHSPSPRTPAPAAAAPAAEVAFVDQVRPDYFAGVLRGDAAALARATKLCEDTLAREPDHVEAMAWHGAIVINQAAQAFQRGDRADGIALWQKGEGEMDRAVELAPDHIGTRIPRGAVLLVSSLYVPEPQRKPMLEKALGDYEHALKLQEGGLDQLSSHGRGMLLYGLADGWHRFGDEAKARQYYERLRAAVPDSAYARRADAYLAGKAPEGQMPCGGCHAR